MFFSGAYYGAFFCKVGDKMLIGLTIRDVLTEMWGVLTTSSTTPTIT